MKHSEVIFADNLTKTYKVRTSSSFFKPSFKKITAVSGINISLKSEECLGILGPNGSGKSTLIKMLAGILYPDAGTLSVSGFTPSDRKKDFLRNIGLFSGGKTQMVWDLPAIDSFELSPVTYGYSKEKFEMRLKMFLDFLNIKEDEIKQPIRNMSLGQKMKSELIYSMLHMPKIMFLDEPTIGLDFMTQKSLRACINTITEQTNMTFIITSHNIKDITECCSKVIVLKAGKVIFDNDTEKIKSFYSKKKKIVIELKTKISDTDILEKYNIKMINNTKFMLEILENELNLTVSDLLRKYEIKDIEIKDEDIEDIIIRMC